MQSQYNTYITTEHHINLTKYHEGIGQSGRDLIDKHQQLSKVAVISKNTSVAESPNELIRKQYQKSKTRKAFTYGPQYFGKYPKTQKKPDIDSQLLNDADSSENLGFSNQVWQQKALEILMIILRFISFITKSNFQTSFRLVNKNVFDIIGDQSSYFKYYLFNGFFKYEKPTAYQLLKYRLYKKICLPLQRIKLYQFLFTHKLIMRPESLISIGWNIYILIILNINVLYVSARVAFKFDSSQGDSDSLYKTREIFFDVLPSYSFILEILLKFNTCYYHNGSVIEDRFKIARNYIKSSFFFDIFVVIPFFISLRFQLEYLDLVLILKVFQITKFSATLFDRLELSSNQIAIFDLIKLGYTILAAAHFCACLWFLIGTTGDPLQKSWVKVSGIEDEQWVSQYLTSFYFSIVTMTTIGYGDIVPQNLRERIFTIGMTVAAVGVFGYSIGNINSIYSEWSRKSYQFRTNMNNLKKYMRIKGLNKHLAERIRKYFEYVWRDAEEDNDMEEFKFADQIPAQLMDEMKIDINMKILQKIPYLNNFSEQFLIQLSKKMFEEKYVPEQVIYSENDSSDYFYILLKGGVEYYVQMNDKDNKTKPLEQLKGQALPFGLLEFNQNQRYSVSCKSISFSYILKIHRKDFLELIRQNSKDYQIYSEMQDQITFMNKQDLINVTCRSCNKITHRIKECPMVCGYPNRTKVLLNHRRNVPEDRKKFKRHSDIRISSRGEMADIQNSVLLYIVKNKSLHQQLESREEVPEFELPDLRLSSIEIDQGRRIKFKECQAAMQDEEILLDMKKMQNQIQKQEQKFHMDSLKVQSTSKIEKEESQNVKHFKSTQNKINSVAVFMKTDQSIKLPSEQQEKLKVDPMNQFESFRNYEYYLVHNNLRHILKVRRT